jgi:hypothetical protein
LPASRPSFPSSAAELVLDALLRGLERDDRRLLVAILLILDRGDEEAREGSPGRRARRRPGRSRPAFPCLPDRGFERVPVALGDDHEIDRSPESRP